MYKWLVIPLLLVVNFANAAAITSSVPVLLTVPGSCQITGVPSAINVALRSDSTVSYSFTFSPGCNFSRKASLSFSASCVDKDNRPCLIDSHQEKVSYAVLFNNQILAPLQTIDISGNQSVNTILIFDQSFTAGTYLGTLTLTINY